MIIAILKIMPLTEKRQEALDILLSVKGPVQAEPGCLGCCVYEEHGDVKSLLYAEQWRSLADLERHLKNNSSATILEAMELSFTIPEIQFYETGETWGLELVERVREEDARRSGRMLAGNWNPAQRKERGAL
jgi:quinol monooxygenase YgiN